MRQTLRFLASPSNLGTSSTLNPAPLALLPPIPLYRRLLRAHRNHLDHEKRVLGDAYIKSEFRAHRNVENPIHIVGFLKEWQMYAQQVEGDSWRGEKLDTDKIDKMSGMLFWFGEFELVVDLRGLDQQLGQLYELMQAIQKKGREDPHSES